MNVKDLLTKKEECEKYLAELKLENRKTDVSWYTKGWYAGQFKLIQELLGHLLDKLQALEDEIFNAAEEEVYFNIEVSIIDGETIRQARYLIDRMCKEASD